MGNFFEASIFSSMNWSGSNASAGGIDGTRRLTETAHTPLAEAFPWPRACGHGNAALIEDRAVARGTGPQFPSRPRPHPL